MLSTGRDSVNLSVLDVMPRLVMHGSVLIHILALISLSSGDLREKLIDSACIGKVIALMIAWDLNLQGRTAAVNAISSLAGHGMHLL
jgi:hypothetical protein